MNQLERIVAGLIDAVRRRDPGALHRPLAVGDLHRALLPYRLFRNALRLDSIEDYQLLLLRLVAEEGGWVRAFPPDAAARCREELAGANPNPDLLDELDEVTIQIGASAVVRIERLRDEETGTALETTLPFIDAIKIVDPAPVVEPENEPLGSAREPEPAPTPVPPMEHPTNRCLHCASPLPPGRLAVFCPFCGQQLQAMPCPRCGTEIEPGWRCCITCGYQPGSGRVAV